MPLNCTAPKVGHPFAHVTAAPILSEELSDAVTPLALTLRAFNAQYVEFTSSIAEGEIGSGHSPTKPNHATLKNGFEDCVEAEVSRGGHRPAQFTIAKFWTATLVKVTVCDLAHILCTYRLIQRVLFNRASEISCHRPRSYRASSAAGITNPDHAICYMAVTRRRSTVRKFYIKYY